MSRRLAQVVLCVLLLAACGGDEVRRQECERFADWSNEIELEAGRRVPTERLAGEDAPTERAAWFRLRATVLREIASRRVPFDDRGVRGLAERRTALVREQAAALEAQAVALERPSASAVQEAQRRESDVAFRTTELFAEWMAQCEPSP